MADIDFLLTLVPRWDRVDRARQFVARRLEGCSHADVIAMVAAELLENAVKYGSRDAPIELAVTASPGSYTVAVSNGLAYDPTDYERLVQILGWLADFDDTGEAYMQILTRSAERGPDNQQSGGLGLVRIAHEGRCTLTAEETEPGNLTVRATHRPRKERCHQDTDHTM